MRRGFTIMEILVGIALLAFLAMLIFGIVSAMFSAVRDLNELVEVHHMVA